MKVIGLCIEYLKDHLNNELKKQTGNAFDNDDIDWIITVPAIWDDEAKQFMRDAAKLVKFVIVDWFFSTIVFIKGTSI